MTWPPEFMAGYLSGFIAGIDRGRELENAEIATLQAWAVASVHAASRLHPWAVHLAGVKARQVASCERQRQAARPWPAEDPTPSARVLNGWPDRMRRAS